MAKLPVRMIKSSCLNRVAERQEAQKFSGNRISSGRYAYADEVIAAGAYLLTQQLAEEGLAKPIQQPLEGMLDELRRTIAEQRRTGLPEVIEADLVIDRWKEIILRVEAGEPLAIARDGNHIARLEPAKTGESLP